MNDELSAPGGRSGAGVESFWLRGDGGFVLFPAVPADFFIDSSRGIVVSKASGVVTYNVTLDHMNRLQGHPDFRSGFNQLFDFREAQIEMSHQEVAALANREVFSAKSRRAFVVQGDLQFGIGRVFEGYRGAKGEEGIMIFREMDEALAWLGLAAVPEGPVVREQSQ